jgi:hypothetical protein
MSLMKLTTEQVSKLNNLVKNECCNCFNGECIMLQLGCMSSILYKHAAEYYRRYKAKVKSIVLT